MWSFVGNKGNKQWIWLAIDGFTKEIVGVYIGKIDQTGAQGLWDSMRAVYRQCAVSYTDFWTAYGIVFSQKKHRAVGKDTGQTNYIERFNNTMRQRISRLVEKIFHSLKYSPIISEPFGILFMSITPLYLSNITHNYTDYAGLPELYVNPPDTHWQIALKTSRSTLYLNV
jgi:IS1 family transposase